MTAQHRAVEQTAAGDWWWRPLLTTLTPHTTRTDPLAAAADLLYRVEPKR